MRILINAVAVKVAGSKSVCINFLRSLEAVGEVHEYYVFLPNDVDYEIFGNKKYLHVKFIPLSIVKPSFRYYIDHIYLRRQVKKIRPDVIFSMGNIALPIKRVPQLLLFHISHPAYPESIYWERIGWRSRLHFKLVVREIVRKFKYATSIAVQTNCIKKRLSDLFELEEKLHVIPNAVSLDALSIDNRTFGASVVKRDGVKTFRFLCLSRYYEHKNIEVFIPLSTLIKERKLNYKITVTIEPWQHKKAAEFLMKVKELHLDDVVENLGPVKMSEVPTLYQEADALILPTLLESFSGTYIEAASYRKPVFTSDFDFAHEVCGDSAIYFNPVDPLAILLKMQLIEDDAFMDKKVNLAVENLKRFPDWQLVTELYLKELDRIAIRKNKR